MKSRVSPGTTLFEVVVADYKHRQPAPMKNLYVDKSGKGIREVVDTIPLRTLFRWAKNGRRAMDWAKKFGSVMSCHKVDSHIHKLQMIDHLRLETKPIEVDITAEEFTIGRDLEIEPVNKSKNIDVRY